LGPREKRPVRRGTGGTILLIVRNGWLERTKEKENDKAKSVADGALFGAMRVRRELPDQRVERRGGSEKAQKEDLSEANRFEA